MLFPGQGSQTADMRDQVERHRPDLLELAQSEVSDDLFERAGDGTRWAQPAIFCAALAGYEVLKDRYEPDLMAGHSLGEISALVAAGALDAEDGLRLVAARGRLMQEAAEETGDGGMLAVRARDRATVEQVAAQAGLSIANDNAPDQLVLSGAARGAGRGRVPAARAPRARQAPPRGRRIPFPPDGAGGRAVPAADRTRGGARAARARPLLRHRRAVPRTCASSSCRRSSARSAGPT